MKLESSHPGPQGKTLVEKIQDELDAAVQHFNEKGQQTEDAWFAEGVAHALGILRSTSSDTELDLCHARLSGTADAEGVVQHDPLRDPWRDG